MKKLKLFSTAFVSLLVGLLMPNMMVAQTFPLKLSSNGRYLVDKDNKPFLINGDTPWLIIQKLTLDEIKLYLDDRKNKKINTIQIMLNDFHTPINDLNRQGNRPFSDSNNFSTVNEAYFLFVDKVINEARNRGIGVIMAPLWRDCCSEGWRTVLNSNGVIKSRQLGEYLGNRYSRSNHPNMIAWMMGGDHKVDDTYDEYKAVAEGIKEKDPGTFLTYHLNPDTMRPPKTFFTFWVITIYPVNYSFTLNGNVRKIFAVNKCIIFIINIFIAALQKSAFVQLQRHVRF